MFSRCEGCSKRARIYFCGLCRRCYIIMFKSTPKPAAKAHNFELGDGT